MNERDLNIKSVQWCLNHNNQSHFCISPTCTYDHAKDLRLSNIKPFSDQAYWPKQIKPTIEKPKKRELGTWTKSAKKGGLKTSKENDRDV
jgi:hypothetical protein